MISSPEPALARRSRRSCAVCARPRSVGHSPRVVHRVRERAEQTAPVAGRVSHIFADAVVMLCCMFPIG